MYGIDILLGYVAAQNSQVPILVEQHKELLVDNIIFDICNLLNARSNNAALEVDLLNTPSILDYGIPDVSYYSPYSTKDQEIVAGIIEDCLTRFEPRLLNIKVTPIEAAGKAGFHFRIKANIILGKEQIAVVLDSNFSSVTRQFLVTK